MANTVIQLKYSDATPTPGSLSSGEAAYSNNSGKLFIGLSNTAILPIGGSYYTAIVDAATDANTASTLVKRDASGIFSTTAVKASLYGNANTATALFNSRNFGLAGADVSSGNVSFDGTGNVVLQSNLSTTGVSAGTYGGATQIPTFAVDAKGRITSAANVAISTVLSFAGETGTGNVNRELEDATREADSSIREATRIQLEAQTKQAELARGKANEAASEANTAAFYADEARKSAEETAKALERAKTASTIINAKESAKETKTAANKATSEANKTVDYAPIVAEAARKSETAANEAKILSDINPSPESILAAEDANKSADKANKSVEVVGKLEAEVYKLSLEAEGIATKAELTRIKYLEPFGYEGEYDKQIKEIRTNNQKIQWYYFNNNLAKWVEIPPANLSPFNTPGSRNNERRLLNGYRLYSYLEPLNNVKTNEIIEDYAISDVYIWNLETLKWTLFQSNETYVITQRIDGFLKQNVSRISKLTNNEIKELKFNGFKNYFSRFEFNLAGNIIRSSFQ
jgi:hypothetical protein